MSESFETFIPEVRAFLSDLAQDNTKAWFEAHKATYTSRLKSPAEILLEAVTPDLEKLTGAEISTKLYRPYRDLRFTKDKTPYHTHLHMAWTAEAPLPSFFFGISPEYVTAGAGWMAFAGPSLAAWREGIGAPEGAQIQAGLVKLKARMEPPELKSVPAPYDRDHPRADLLRRKSFVLWRDKVEAREGPLPEALADVFGGFWPVLSQVRDALA